MSASTSRLELAPATPRSRSWLGSVLLHGCVIASIGFGAAPGSPASKVERGQADLALSWRGSDSHAPTLDARSNSSKAGRDHHDTPGRPTDELTFVWGDNGPLHWHPCCYPYPCCTGDVFPCFDAPCTWVLQRDALYALSQPAQNWVLEETRRLTANALRRFERTR